MSARAVGLAVALAACGPTPPMADAACVMSLPTCSASPPTYAATIAPLIHDRCVTCHYAGSALAPIDLSTYADVHSHQGVVLGQLYVCHMPPITAPQLTGQARVQLLEWLECGAHDD